MGTLRFCESNSLALLWIGELAQRPGLIEVEGPETESFIALLMAEAVGRRRRRRVEKRRRKKKKKWKCLLFMLREREKGQRDKKTGIMET